MIDMLKALGEENRIKIIRLLSVGSLCVCELVEKIGISQNLMSHHLGVLKSAGLISDCRCGKNNYYTLNKKSMNSLTKMLTKLGGNGEN